MSETTHPRVLFNGDSMVLFPDFGIKSMHQAAAVLGLLLYEVYRSQISLIKEYDFIDIMRIKIDTR